MDRRSLKKIPIGIIIYCLFVFLVSCSDSKSISKNWETYSFVDPEGQLISSDFWKEKKSVIYFGFSHCPDMCPLALTNFGRTSLILGEKAKEFRFIFITLDPARDSPNVLKNYVNTFPGKQLTALSPSIDTLQRLQNDLGVVRKKIGNDSDYRIDHSNFIYVFDENGKPLSNYLGGLSANALANHLREFLIP